MSTIFVEAFGKLPPNGDIDAKEEDLYSVFNSRAEMMGLSTTALPRPECPLLWGMNEAELTEDSSGKLIEDPSGRIGYVQVGTMFNIIGVLVPLLQCFDDALRRFGTVELTGIQVTAGNLETYTQFGITELNWFNIRRDLRAQALVTCGQELLGAGNTADLAAELSRWRGTFRYGTAIQAPDGSPIATPAETPFIPVSPNLDGLGIPVVLPEWTASAAAWAMGIVVEVARARNHGARSLAVRLTRAS